MSHIAESMSADHKRCDEIFSEAEEAVAIGDWPRGAEDYRRLRKALEHHFAMEEEVLFPTFEERTGMTQGPTQVMRAEHAQMRQLLQEMAESVEGENRESYLGQSETLLMIMQQHNAKEEQILYRMADQALGADAEEIYGRMQAV